MALRKWIWSVALPILLALPAAQAEQAVGCIQDDPALIRQAGVAEPAIPLAFASDSLDVARRLNAAGDVALEHGDLVTAQAYHRRALAIRLRLAPHSLMAAESLNALGNVALDRGDYAAARRYLERSLRMRQALAPGSRDVALSLMSLGNFARRRGEVIRQEDYYSQALGVGDALTPPDLADALDGLGGACGQRPCTQMPQDYLHRALQIRQQWQPASLAMAGTLSYLGRSANNQGDLQEAEQDFAQALELRRRLAPGSLALAASLTDLGVLARARGNLATAELCLRQALQIRRRLAPHSLAVADSLHNLGIVLWLRDDLDGAQDYFEQTLRMRRKLIPGSPSLAQSLIWQGLLCMRREQLTASQAYFEQALELLDKDLSPDSLAVAAVLSNLGNVARVHGELALSQEYYRKALAIQDRQAPDSPAEAGNLLSLGGLVRQQGNLAAAETYYRRALAIQEQKVPDSSAHAAVLFSLASLLRQENKREDAERLYAQGVDVLERQTARLGGTPEERSVFRARYENNYKDYVDLLVALGHTEMALRVLERARAWALLETLARAQVSLHGRHDSGLDRTKHSLEEEIGARLSYRIRLLDGRHTEAQLSELERRLAELRDRYRETDQQILLQNPAYAALTHPQTLTGQQIQDLLDDDTLLLEYSLGPGASHVWAVTRTTLAVYGLPARNIIEQAVSRVRELMTARGLRPKESDARRRKRLMLADAQYPAAARELSRLVLGPVAGLLGNRRIVIVSDGALQYLPFAALPAPSGQASGSAPRSSADVHDSADSADTPLVMQHEVTNLPSASVLAELRRQALERIPPPKAVAVLADPVFDSRDERIERSAANDAASELTSSSNKVLERPLAAGLRQAAAGADRTAAVYLDRLLWTRLEAAQILKVTPAGEGLQALDFEASRATALSPVLSQYRIVHFATHAVSDSEHPERSGLVLSLFDRHGQPQNGFLGLEQIYSLNLPADLVVLSACDTGLGREVGGEGLVGLVRGFMYAGATRVMASLWSVDDEVTAQLMAHFYKSLEQDGLSPAAALRAAQIEVRKQGRWSSPYYWAGFQIEGEWR
jgi:CHAT domain-containing protein/Tfp pilus assembly protein PilF